MIKDGFLDRLARYARLARHPEEEVAYPPEGKRSISRTLIGIFLGFPSANGEDGNLIITMERRTDEPHQQDRTQDQ